MPDVKQNSQSGSAAASGSAATSDQAATPASAGGLAGSFVITSSQREELLHLPLPSHQLKFEESELRELLADSISLSFAEKKKTISILGRLSQEQLDELLVILREEKQKLQVLDAEHRRRLETVDAQAKGEQVALARELAEKLQQEKDNTEIQRIREELFGNQG